MASRSDPLQASILAVLALILGAGGLILPLPLGLAGILVAGWGVYRYGRTALGGPALIACAALTAAGFILHIML